MTKREALRILIDHAVRDVAGTGCGIRAPLTNEEQRRVVEAMSVIWPQVYGYPLGDNDLFNRGISVPLPTEGRRR